MERKIKLKFKDLGEQRWVCTASMDHNTRNRFLAWAKANIPECKINTMNDFYLKDNPPYTYTLEIRGGDLNARTLLGLSWS